MEELMLKQYLETGKIVGTHGVRGEVRVEPWCDSPEFLCKFKTLYLDANGNTAVKVKSARKHGNIVLLSLDGIDDINAAEKLRSKVIYISRSDSSLAGTRSFIQDLIGCDVIDADSGAMLGKLTDVITGIANDVWCVQKDGKEYLLPAIDDVIVDKSPEDGVLTVRPLKGIFDDED